MKRKHGFVTFLIFLLCAAGIAVYAFWPFNEKEQPQRHRTHIIVPTTTGSGDSYYLSDEDLAYDDNYILKAPLGDGETAISVLNVDFANSGIEGQIVAFRVSDKVNNPVSIAFFGYDDQSLAYRRWWDAPVTATVPGTVSLYTQDMIGDRGLCVIITGMNDQGEHTMTVFRKDPQGNRIQPFTQIAGIQTDGSITIQEVERPLAYQQGISGGRPFAITAWGHDSESDNILDRIEITYTFNPAREMYVQSGISHIPGSQIEQRRLREVLSGGQKAFEEFLSDLWYHVSPEGTIDTNQYLYFDPPGREIVFFSDDTQQVFVWQNSNTTRYGIYIAGQNISVLTLRRFLDIEMESMDSIRVRVREDVRMKIGITESWDGAYRRARSTARPSGGENNIRPYTDAVYDSSMGRLRFHASGEYELNSGGVLTKGRYAFFRVGGNDLIELRPDNNGAKSGNGDNRMVYTLTVMDITTGNLSLSRVRLGASGIHELHEVPIILTQAQ